LRALVAQDQKSTKRKTIGSVKKVRKNEGK
jgi:hypothetical protein